MRPPRSKRDCPACYGNGMGCLSCSGTGRADMTDYERADYEDAMEARAEARADERDEDRAR